MKLIVVALALVSLAGVHADSCDLTSNGVTDVWVDMARNCTGELQRQIHKEIEASLEYLSMASYFSRDTVNRPGFAKLFFEAASEEREHGLKLIEYLLMRGELTTSVTNLIKLKEIAIKEWKTEDALKHALELEASVTNSIRTVIANCEVAPDKRGAQFNDYHLVDYLSGDFLDEQYNGQRDLAGKLSTLNKMKASQGNLGEFLFDKKLLNGGLFK